ncbi:hypothetical protein O7A70_19965 [Mesorhizobium sp. Cs1299R1N1]|uniref:hypothetical protein n=1 Tax=Mesorhizobium sp. Cs1299R1N1 TaxID=3015172 RepID=UPI00301C9E92
MNKKDNRRGDLDQVPVAGFLMIFFPIWTVICAPMGLWIAVSAFLNIVSFFIELFSYSISISRWLIAGVLLFCGMVVQIVFLYLLLTGQSERQKLKRIAVLSIPLMMMFSIPIVLIGNGMA